jgi:adenosylhomocysteine nucleosidase
MSLGIMGAMREEVDALLPHIEGARIDRRAGRDFVHGSLWGTPVSVVFSRWGKVAAASTATELVVAHGAERLVFCGIAGSLDPGLHAGDVVVARRLFQHDMDASPFFAPLEIPLLGITGIQADAAMSESLLAAADRFVRHDLPAAADPALVGQLHLDRRRAVAGDIASGDRVIFTAAAKEQVKSRVPTAACVEMEGAAVAQVCHEHGIPFACVRTISDAADETGHESVVPFFGGLAGVYTLGIIRRWLGA